MDAAMAVSSIHPVPAAHIGAVTGITGSSAVIRMRGHQAAAPGDGERTTIGRLVGIDVGSSLVVGTIVRMRAASEGESAGDLVADVDFMGEVREYGTARASFQRGISSYPAVGHRVLRLGADEIAIIHHVAEGETIEVGRLTLDARVPAYVNFNDMLSKHFAVLGTTGVGKSSAVALILREVLARQSNLRAFLFDPHNEYAGSFGDMAHVMTPKNLVLPFWLFNFEEIVDVFFRGRPGVEEEIEILQEVIPLAKAMYAAGQKGDRILLRKNAAGGGGYTADTPVPYRISDLVQLIDERMGRLENRSIWTKYHRLIARIETLGNDSRYAFMFSSLFVEDLMVQVVGDLFRMPMRGKPITVMQLAGFPSEVLDSVVSVICRMGFEFGIWSDGSAPLLFACEEAHRYVPADKKLGFGPTRKALSRIAKEGRKYGIYLGAITQRPADLDAAILSQCSTVFAMRLANDADQAIVKSAVPDAAASLVAFLPSLGNREGVAFGEGVPLPTRFRFADLPTDAIPRSTSGRFVQHEAGNDLDRDFLAAVVERWRDSTVTSQRPRSSLSALDRAGSGEGDDTLSALTSRSVL